MSTQRPKPRFFSLNLLVVGVLLLQFALALGSVTHNGPTMDEQGFIVRGLAYLRNEQRQIRVGHPLGLNALNSFLLVNDDTVHLPTQDPSWQGTSFHRPGELFLWEIGNDVPRIMFLARLPSVWLGLLLAAVVGRWAREMSRRRWAGVLALSLVALDPNFLAHSSLATTDLGLAAAAAFLWLHPLAFLAATGLGTGHQSPGRPSACSKTPNSPRVSSFLSSVSSSLSGSFTRDVAPRTTHHASPPRKIGGTCSPHRLPNSSSPTP